MHILISVLGVAGAIAYYWYVLRDVGNVAGSLADAAGRARGDYRRRQFCRKAEASTIQAITDPRIAAVVIAVAVAGCEGDMTADQDERLKQAMLEILAVDDPAGDLTFAKWAVRDVSDPNNISMRLNRLLVSALNDRERRQLVEIVHDVASAGGALSPVQSDAIMRLRTRLKT